jgi:hypothetical protein
LQVTTEKVGQAEDRVKSWPAAKELIAGGKEKPEKGAKKKLIAGGKGKPLEKAAKKKLEILGLDVTHFANVAGKFDQPRGLLGKTSFVAHLGDGATLEARLSRPAHAILLAFRPDGIEELCYPEREDEAPPLTDRPRYPSVSRGVNYGLTDGEGLQVFAVVASSKPLPSYKAWRSRLGQGPWKKFAAPPDVVWWDNGEQVAALTGPDHFNPRGKGQEVSGKTAVAALTDWLRQGPEVEAVAALGFAVLPKNRP